MSENHLFLMKSGITGWEDTHNRTASLVANRFGIGTNLPLDILHVSESGSKAKVRIEQSYYEYTGKEYQAVVSFTDTGLNEAGFVGFGDVATNDLTISNKSIEGDPNINVALPGGVGHVAAFTSGGRMGLRTADPLYTFHVSEPGDSDLALIGTSASSNEFVIKNQGLVGVGTSQPAYRLHVTGDTFAHQYLWEQEEEADREDVVIDFDGPNFRTIYLGKDQDTKYVFSTINGADSNAEKEIKAVTIRIEPTGTDYHYRTLSFQKDIRFLGTAPTGIPSGIVGVLAFNSFGPSNGETVGVYRQEGDDITGPPGPVGVGGTGMTSEGFGNRIIGGEFSTNPWQRGTYFEDAAGYSNQWPVSAGEYTADRFIFIKSGYKEFDIYKDADAPSEFQIGFHIQDSLKIEPDQKATSVMGMPPDMDGPELYALEQRVEGFNWRYLGCNPVFLSFFVKSSQTGAGCVYMQNGDRSFSCVNDYIIHEANSWEQKLIPVAPSIHESYVHNIVPHAEARMSNTDSIIGGSSLLLGPRGINAGDYLETCFHQDFDFGTDDFTIEAFCKFDSFSEDGCLYSNSNESTINALLWDPSAGKFNLYVNGNSVGHFSSPPLVGTLSTLHWYHVALTRTNTDFNLWISGRVSPDTLASTQDFGDASSPVRIGASGAFGGFWDGYIDEYRISSVSRYSTDFAPPTFSFVGGGADPHTKLLLHMEGANGSNYFVDSAYDPVPVYWDYKSGTGMIVGWTLNAGADHKLPTGESCASYYKPNEWVTGTYFGYNALYETALCSGDFSLSAVNLNRSLDYSYIDRPYQLELELCQRYYEVQTYHTDQAVSCGQNIGVGTATGFHIDYQTTKRIAPRITTAGGFDLTDTYADKLEVIGLHFDKANIFSASAGAEVELRPSPLPNLNVGNMTILSSSGADTPGRIIIDSEL